MTTLGAVHTGDVQALAAEAGRPAEDALLQATDDPAGEADRMRLRRIPVRRTDPDSFVARKLTGDLSPERAYARLVRLGKSAGLSG